MTEVAALDRLESRMVLEARLRALSGLRIGAAKDVGGTGADLPVLRDGRGLPYIPGSSFKGVLRSAVESLVRGVGPAPETRWSACSAPPTFWSCDPLNLKGDRTSEDRGLDEACLSNRWKDALRGSDDELPLALALTHSCNVCQLFGNTEIAGRVLIADLPLQNAEEMLAFTEVRDGVAIDRDLLTARPRAKYDFEVVPAGAVFALEIVAENLTATQQGLLAAGLEALHEGHVRLGGFGSRGLGRVILEHHRCATTDARRLLTGAPPDEKSWTTFVGEGQQALAVALQQQGG